MFSTLKITTKPEMSNETLLPPCGWSFSITVETKMVTFMTAACRTGSMANADVQKQAINQHLLPFCGRKALSSHRTCSCTASRKGRHFMFLLLITRSSQRNHSADDQLTVSLFTVECFDWELSGRKTRQEATQDKSRTTDKQMKNCNKDQN